MAHRITISKNHTIYGPAREAQRVRPAMACVAASAIGKAGA
jgi:hypothetical protein